MKGLQKVKQNYSVRTKKSL